ncbi:Hsp20/alpha crystallin family protein [Actinopolymorpha sp. B17G11]|uniref:Hsp20/alpha crystallin family protein n=1 Tax=unclassified Actinopolymorpha TaxID=2627063 RepID=UPI0032D9A787
MTSLSKHGSTRGSGLFSRVEEELRPKPFLRQFTGRQAIRVEDYSDEGQYVLRAELPGIDPTKDVDISVANGTLTMRVERREVKKDVNRSEFRYGTFQRSVQLPRGADEEDVRATYDNGILEVRVGVRDGEEQAPARHIPISRG